MLSKILDVLLSDILRCLGESLLFAAIVKYGFRWSVNLVRTRDGHLHILLVIKYVQLILSYSYPLTYKLL